ncbi:MAG: hypothetical protein CMC05_13195 [Flavobacteriaceae bacterium]|nr:hypothetical protein [Flavobacteriaceae bacterium]MBD09326.1 hypothetical protein [Flavobacteriaceae bacterium]|tara:strand:- start:53279 stop:53818 length:540 start_codon:yes stop_codon:yes gene_type:complete
MELYLNDMRKLKKMEEKTNQDKLSGLYILLTFVIIIWVISAFIVPCLYPKLSDRALLGDSFGVINSLFSGLAFAGIIYTILLQRKELALQRQELKDTRIELNRSATAQENSERQQRRQSANLKTTAKLNALSTLVSYYSNVETKTKNSDGAKYRHAQSEQEIYIQRIKEILNRKESFND